MRIKIINAIPCLLMLAPLTSIASSQPVAENVNYNMDKLSINAAAGFLAGESREYVYDENDEKLSQLNWKINGAAIIKGEFNVDFLPWFSLNANGWTTMQNNHAVMDDYDWLDPDQSGWSDWSHHPDTDLNYANNIDLNVRGWFLQKHPYKLGATAGYERSSFDFLARGGCYRYDSGTDTGCFPDNEIGIGYQATFQTVYLGLVGEYRLNNFEFNTTVKISPWVQANDIDQHYERNLTFTERGNNSSFSSIAVAAGYYIRQDINVFFEATYNQFTNGKADMWIYDHETGDTDVFSDAAGLSNQNYVLTLGVRYTPHLS